MTYLSPMFDSLRGLLENGSTFIQIPWFLLLSVASLRNRELTRPVAYLGIAAAVWDALIVVRLLPGNTSTGSPLGLVLLVAVGVVLLVRPDLSRARKTAVAQANA